MNTPSHHRVHHGKNVPYLDRNHGGIFIIWDRLFGTFAPEAERVVYGLTKDIQTFNPLRIGVPRVRRDRPRRRPRSGRLAPSSATCWRRRAGATTARR